MAPDRVSMKPVTGEIKEGDMRISEMGQVLLSDKTVDWGLGAYHNLLKEAAGWSLLIQRLIQPVMRSC